MEERYNLAIDRMKAIIEEKTVAEPYREYSSWWLGLF